MSIHFYDNNEDTLKNESINNFSSIFKKYNTNTPSLSDALNEMFFSAGISSQKAYEFTEDIIFKSSEIVKYNFELINQKYPTISEEEAKIISSYTCEAKNPYYSPYKILNRSLFEEKREEGIKKVSKYFYIFLKVLRKLDVYYPDKKYMFRCINKKINLNEDFFKKNAIKYKQGNKKTFWGFTSISSELNLKYYSNGKKKDIKEGTIFDLCGNIWGYDISLFNKMLDEQIILEPEQESEILNVVPPSKNDFIHVRCLIKKSPIILKDIKNGYIKITYKFDGKMRDIRIFGDKFVERNKDLKFIYENKKYDLKSSLSASELKSNIIHIYLSGINSITNLSHMFSCCEEVNYISFNRFQRYNNITDINYLFYNCSSLKSLPDDISNWDISYVTNINSIFSYCDSLQSLPDISKWDTSNITDISKMFLNCSSLSYLPDISKWDISNVTNMKGIFSGCSSLIYLPDISKWDISSAKDISSLFYNCKSLKGLPDISKWNTSRVIEMEEIFYKCSSLSYLPDISKWNTSKVTNMKGIFYECLSLSYLPDISKWNTTNVKDISNLFYNCNSLLYLPDISKWKTSNVKDMRKLFYKCSSISRLPDISKWDTSNVIDMEGLFYKCSSISILPDISKWNLSNVHITDYFLDECSSLSKIPYLSNWAIHYYLKFDFGGCISL